MVSHAERIHNSFWRNVPARAKQMPLKVSFLGKKTWQPLDHLRELREKETTPIDVIYMFNKFRTFGIDLSFCLRKEAVIDLLKTLDEDLSTLYKEKSDAYTAAATVYSFGILYNRGEISRRSLAIYLVFLYLLPTLSHSPGFNAYRETKRTLPVTPWDVDRYQEKVSLLGGVRKLLYS